MVEAVVVAAQVVEVVVEQVVAVGGVVEVAGGVVVVAGAATEMAGSLVTGLASGGIVFPITFRCIRTFWLKKANSVVKTQKIKTLHMDIVRKEE